MSVPEYKSAVSAVVLLAPPSTPLPDLCDRTVTLLTSPFACPHIYGYPSCMCLSVYDKSQKEPVLAGSIGPLLSVWRK